MDEFKLMETLTRLESQVNRAFDNIKEAKETGLETRSDVKAIVVSVNELKTDVAILKDNNLDKRVSDLEQFRWKFAGAMIVINVLVTVAITVSVKLLFK